MENVVEEIRKFVEEECKKPTSKYGYQPYVSHFTSVHRYAKLLAENRNADIEIVELAAWLHDIGSIIHRRKDHHITSTAIAERELSKLSYPKEKIEGVKHCILAHRGSQGIKRETKEAEIIAEADAMSHFDNITGIFRAALTYEGLDEAQTQKSVKKKLVNSWDKLSPESKVIIKEKFDAAMLLLN